MKYIFAGHLGLDIFSINAAGVLSVASLARMEAKSTSVSLGSTHTSEVGCGIVGESSVSDVVSSGALIPLRACIRVDTPSSFGIC